MRISVALCTALAATLATGAPIVRVVQFEDSPVQAEALSTASQLSPPTRQQFTTETVVNNGLATEDGLHHGLRKHGAPFHHGHHGHHGHRRHRQPWLRLLAWLFPSAHTGPKRFGPFSSMTQEEVGGRPRPHHHPTIAELEMEGARPSYRYVPCPHPRHGGRHFYRVRKYADMAIVSIVFTFIGVVALIELWGPIRRRFSNSESGEGSIRLPDEEKLIPVPETLSYEPEVDQKSGSSDDASAEKSEQS